jgi:hypothetical protein
MEWERHTPSCPPVWCPGLGVRPRALARAELAARTIMHDKGEHTGSQRVAKGHTISQKIAQRAAQSHSHSDQVALYNRQALYKTARRCDRRWKGRAYLDKQVHRGRQAL